MDRALYPSGEPPPMPLSDRAPPTAPDQPVAARATRIRCLIGCMLALSVSIGPALIASFSIMVKPVSEQFGWGRGPLLLGIAIFSLAGVLLTPFVGAMIDRSGPRRITLAAALTLPCAALLQAAVPANFAVFVGIAVAAALLSCLSHTATYMNVVARAFDRRLGLAIALSMSGVSIGQAVLGILAQHLLDAFGWRLAWVGIAAFVAVVGLAAFAIIPWRAVSLLPAAARVRARQPGVWRSLLQTPLFWALTLSLLLVFMVTTGISLNLVASLRDRGLTGSRAAVIAAILPVFGVVGRLVTGALIDRLRYTVVGALLFTGQAVGCVLLSTNGSEALVYLAVALVGLGWGAESDLLSFVAKRRFGMSHFGAVLGLMAGMVQIAVMIGPLLAGYTFDHYGSYRIAFEFFAASSFVAALLILISGRLPPPAWAVLGDGPGGVG